MNFKKIADTRFKQSSINSKKFSNYPDIRKRFNIIPVHKKNEKQLGG